MDIQFKYLEIDTSKGLNDAEFRIEGKGLIVLSAPVQCTIKINSKLADPIPAIAIEKLYADIQKIYVTTPPDIGHLKLIVIQDESVYVDANTAYDTAASTGAFLANILLSGAKRGNKLEIVTLDPANSPITVQDLYVAGPYIIDNILGFTILEGNGTDWILTSEAVHPADITKSIISTVDLSGLEPGDKVDLISHVMVFTAGANASTMKIAVSYLFSPIWGH